MPRTLGVICARGGSKGLPGKNLMQVNGKSMIQHSIEQARGSKLLTRWVVSTDNVAIQEVANAYQKDCAPFLRPAELAEDDSRIEGALQHALEWCEREDESYDYICMLLNTMPLRTSEDIDGCVEMMGFVKINGRLIAVPRDSVISGYMIDHPYEIRPVNFDGRAFEATRLYRTSYTRQDSPEVFLGNGCVVVMTRECLVEKNSIWGDKSRLYPMPAFRSIDIDTPDDLQAVESILRGMQYAVPRM